MHFGQIIRVFVLDIGIAERILARKNRIIVQVRIFEESRDRIHAKSCRATIQPEAQHVIHCFAHFWVAPVQVRLLNIEIVVIPLSGLGVEGPRGVPKP